MRGRSHIALGQYLLSAYMPGLGTKQRRAFLLGCIQPDRNPATYLKGSIRFQWLRGHNYLNARRFMARISSRLERKHSLNLLDYYTLGKLIHYTADAFTSAHNAFFPKDLAVHRDYEHRLQDHFLRYLGHRPPPVLQPCGTAMEVIAGFHREYSREAGNVHRDSRFVLQACCCVLALILTPGIP